MSKIIKFTQFKPQKLRKKTKHMANSLNSSNYQNRIINLSDLQNQSQEMDLYNTDPEELLIQCKDEEELTEKICSLIKKIREKEGDLLPSLK